MAFEWQLPLLWANVDEQGVAGGGGGGGGGGAAGASAAAGGQLLSSRFEMSESELLEDARVRRDLRAAGVAAVGPAKGSSSSSSSSGSGSAQVARQSSAKAAAAAGGGGGSARSLKPSTLGSGVAATEGYNCKVCGGKKRAPASVCLAPCPQSIALR